MTAIRVILVAAAVLVAVATTRVGAASPSPCSNIIIHPGGGGGGPLVRYFTTTQEGVNGAGRTPDLDSFGAGSWAAPDYVEGTHGETWQSGATPFGENIFCASIYNQFSLPTFVNVFATDPNPPGLAVNTLGTPNSVWPRNSDIFVRATFTLGIDASQYQAYLNVVKDNSLAGVYLNGVLLTNTPYLRDGCDGVAQLITIAIPQGLMQPGTNVLAIRAHDKDGAYSAGNQSFLNFELRGDAIGDHPSHVTTTGNCVCLLPESTSPVPSPP